MYICTDCQPAGITIPQMDDMVGRCEACGQRDGNLRRYVPSALTAQRGWYVNSQGRQVTVPGTRHT